MDCLKPRYYFNFAEFSHRTLFESAEYVWEALSLLSQYMESLSYRGIFAKVPKGAYLDNEKQIHIGEGSVIEPGCYIKGPCWIGKNCTIRQGAYVRGYCLTGDGCVIGHATEAKHAILLNGAHAAHFAYLGDSIVGAANLGAGAKCANLKLDGSCVAVTVNQKRFETGMRKFGAIIGDRTQIGCNAVMNPGTLVGADSFCYPCVNFGGFVPQGSVVKSSLSAIVQNKKAKV